MFTRRSHTREARRQGRRFSQAPVVATGTTPPTVTLTGQPIGAWTVEIDISLLGALGVAQFQWRLNGVVQQTAQVTAATFALGTTGLVANFPAGTYAVDNVYISVGTAY